MAYPTSVTETTPKLYGELASWWPLLSAPADYEEEAAFYLRHLMDACERPARSLLELGSGGGSQPNEQTPATIFGQRGKGGAEVRRSRPVAEPTDVAISIDQTLEQLLVRCHQRQFQGFGQRDVSSVIGRDSVIQTHRKAGLHQVTGWQRVPWQLSQIGQILLCGVSVIAEEVSVLP